MTKLDDITSGNLRNLARSVKMVPIIPEDREEFGRALILQGYAAARAAQMAAVEILDNDGALQMLARHRIRYSADKSA